LLTENEVSRSWSRIFSNGVDTETLDRAERLLEELRPESPLLHRLTMELDELRSRHSNQAGAIADKA
jgi:hypothetical protein